MDSPAGRVRAYYRALDDGDYAALSDLLAPDFVQERPDRTLAGRERFVRFMREERPRTDTVHAVDAVYVDAAEADGTGTTDDGTDAREVAVRGRLLTAEGDRLVGFVDVFTVGDDGLGRLDTYTQ